MASAGGNSRGFFAYYREYAKSGIHAASAAALTVFIGLAGLVNRWFVVAGIVVYVLPPVFLYLSREGERVPSVVGDDTGDTGDTHESENEGNTSETDHGRDRKPDFDTDESEFDTDESEFDTDEPEPGWNEAETPTSETLLDVVSVRDSAFAVGEGGVVLARDDEWELALEDGPTANANPLRGVDATAEGEAVWFAGDSGVLGRFDGRLTDHSAPEDRTSTWTDLAVTGGAGEEQVHLVNGSGELLRGKYDDGRVSWDGIEKPASGSNISGIEFAEAERGHLCDTNQGVFETADGGETYERIGIEDANAAFAGISAADSTVVVACDDGSVFRYDRAVWTRLRVAENALSAIDLTEKGGLAAGDAGAIFELVEGSWEPVETLVDADLAGIAVGGTSPDIAVGTGGQVIERRR